MTIRTMSALALLSAVLVLPALADPPTAASQPATEPASQPASQPAVFKATEKDAIAKLAGSTATVTGAVSRTNWYNDEILFINFKGTQRGDFTVIARQDNRDALDKAFNGDIANAIDRKTISVTGKIILYHGHPEIEITKPDQLTILPDAKDAPATEPAK
ncbi:MAG TPA: hypothetical protein VM008_15015 [Phycisphaerae bacterium]|nr:hypothetical protein [Phycisphaerae bacterium]